MYFVKPEVSHAAVHRPCRRALRPAEHPGAQPVCAVQLTDPAGAAGGEHGQGRGVLLLLKVSVQPARGAGGQRQGGS